MGDLNQRRHPASTPLVVVAVEVTPPQAQPTQAHGVSGKSLVEEHMASTMKPAVLRLVLVAMAKAMEGLASASASEEGVEEDEEQEVREIRYTTSLPRSPKP